MRQGHAQPFAMGAADMFLPQCPGSRFVTCFYRSEQGYMFRIGGGPPFTHIQCGGPEKGGLDGCALQGVSEVAVLTATGYLLMKQPVDPDNPAGVIKG